MSKAEDNSDASNRDVGERTRSRKSRTFGCIAALTFPLAVAAAFGGSCAVLGPIKAERDLVVYMVVFACLTVASVIAALLLAVKFWSK